jgi:hypothetical protein
MRDVFSFGWHSHWHLKAFERDEVMDFYDGDGHWSLLHAYKGDLRKGYPISHKGGKFEAGGLGKKSQRNYSKGTSTVCLFLKRRRNKIKAMDWTQVFTIIGTLSAIIGGYVFLINKRFEDMNRRIDRIEQDIRDIRTELKEMRTEITEIKVLLYRVLEIPHKGDKG